MRIGEQLFLLDTLNPFIQEVFSTIYENQRRNQEEFNALITRDPKIFLTKKKGQNSFIHDIASKKRKSKLFEKSVLKESIASLDNPKDLRSASMINEV